MIIASSALHASFAIFHLKSNAHSWHLYLVSHKMQGAKTHIRLRCIYFLKCSPSGHGQQIQDEEEDNGGRCGVFLHHRAAEDSRNIACLRYHSRGHQT